MAMTLKEFKKSCFRNATYFKSIKTQKHLNDLADEIRSLGVAESNECLYEFCMMEGFDPDDVLQLVL